MITVVERERLVLHELALGVELRDAVTGLAVVGQPKVFLEKTRLDKVPLPVPLESSGGGRFRYRYDMTSAQLDIERTLTFRVVDEYQLYVPRRFKIKLRPRSDVLAVGAHIPATLRFVQVSLFPGVMYPVPAGATVLRGLLVRTETKLLPGSLVPTSTKVPLPWCRVELVGLRVDAGQQTPFTHCDGKGQFTLLVRSPRGPPPADWAPNQLRLRVTVPAVDAADPIDELSNLAAVELLNGVTALGDGDFDPGGVAGPEVPVPSAVALGRIHDATYEIP